jgi:peptidoglycan/LPS O-acetylase OafA/YrhL
MRRLHLVAGLVALAVFLGTGVYMKMHVHNLDTTTRLLLRSLHIYLLFAALLNLVLGLHNEPVQRGWRMWLRRGGSVLVLMAPVLFVLAFCREPWLAGLKRPFALPGVISSLAGVICHLVSGIGNRPSCWE